MKLAKDAVGDLSESHTHGGGDLEVGTQVGLVHLGVRRFDRESAPMLDGVPGGRRGRSFPEPCLLLASHELCFG
jgi:hypothetical protein